ASNVPAPGAAPARKAAATSAMRVDPVAPKARAAPYRKIAEAKLPRMKYLNAASDGRLPRRRYAQSAYTASDITSREMKMTIRSVACASRHIPAAEKSASA